MRMTKPALSYAQSLTCGDFTANLAVSQTSGKENDSTPLR
jgi:hypothetical protein